MFLFLICFKTLYKSIFAQKIKKTAGETRYGSKSTMERKGLDCDKRYRRPSEVKMKRPGYVNDVERVQIKEQLFTISKLHLLKLYRTFLVISHVVNRF